MRIETPALPGTATFFNTAASWGLRPALPPAGGLDFKPPQGSRYELSNGLVFHLLSDPTLPVVHISAIVKTGKLYDTKDKIGLGELAAALLKDGGTLRYRSEDIDDTLDLH